MKSFMVSYEAATLLKTPATFDIISSEYGGFLREWCYLEPPSLPLPRSQIRNALFFHGL
jgi:hypothetical protein